MLSVTVLLLLTVLLYANAHYGLLSLAGLDDKGLPVRAVRGKLGSDQPVNSEQADHSQWSVLLKKHVDADGDVNYKGFLQDKEVLKGYLDLLAEKVPEESSSVQEQLAYYINLYNARTVYLILENYPVKSIKDIPGAWTRDIVRIGQKEISLGGLEHSILRKMNEPRIHFAINCASGSCPKLWNEAYTAEKLNFQLDRATRDFINSTKHNSISPEKMELSRIFKWYRDDFIDGNLIEYIKKYSSVPIKANTKIRYKDYDWSLNGTRAP